jgi:hypothetical protein
MQGGSERSWMQRAGEIADHKLRDPAHLQGLALMAMAEALHRLAAAVEAQNAGGA